MIASLASDRLARRQCRALWSRTDRQHESAARCAGFTPPRPSSIHRDAAACRPAQRAARRSHVQERFHARHARVHAPAAHRPARSRTRPRGVRAALPGAIHRPGVRRASRRHRCVDCGRLGGLRRGAQGTAHPSGRRGFPGPHLRSVGRMARCARCHPERRGAPAQSAIPRPGAVDLRLAAQRTHLSGRDVEDLAPARSRTRGGSGRRRRVRRARTQPPDVRIRARHPSLQRLRIHGDAAVPLALLLLSQPRPGPAPRLDERDLPAVGGGARGDDRDAGALEPGHLAAETDDGSTGLRRRR